MSNTTRAEFSVTVIMASIHLGSVRSMPVRWYHSNHLGSGWMKESRRKSSFSGFSSLK